MKKIMVVDDSGVQRKMIIGIIRKAGYTNEVLEAGDGEQAIEVLGSLILPMWGLCCVIGICQRCPDWNSLPGWPRSTCSQAYRSSW